MNRYCSESGLEVTITDCTFFRNYAGTSCGAYILLDVWPLVGTVDRTDYLQNEAPATQHDGAEWSAFPTVGQQSC